MGGMVTSAQWCEVTDGQNDATLHLEDQAEGGNVVACPVTSFAMTRKLRR